MLTDAGAALLAAVKPHVVDHEARMVADLDAAERSSLSGALRKVFPKGR
jgi:DNA-binding MarR family transcriptional regulator